MRNLDLIFDPISKTYEAPLQMKANNGLFVIDDFGRQSMRPQDLLNRWIVPLELRIDFLTLQTGKKIEIPFDELIVFSTNLDPRDLVDDAFLRRIRHKLLIDFPDEKIYYQIMQRECAGARHGPAAGGLCLSDAKALYRARPQTCAPAIPATSWTRSTTSPSTWGPSRCYPSS